MENSYSLNLDDEIHWVSKYLPHQGTLQHFVHHNPLGAFEDYDFGAACRVAKKLYQGNRFLSQGHYLAYIKMGKITQAALREQINTLLQSTGVHPEPSLIENLLVLLCNPPQLSVKSLIVKQIEQEDILPLTQEIEAVIQSTSRNSCPLYLFYYPTYKDIILEQQGIDIDDIINPVLAKFFSSYADPGSTYWKNEYKENGLWHCFKSNFKSRFFLENLLAQKIHIELSLPQYAMMTVDELIHEYCQKLNLKPHHTKRYLLGMALRLRGWASLFNQLEHEPEQRLDKTDFQLKEFLLVKLIFEYIVCKDYLSHFSDNILDANMEKQYQREQNEYQSELTYLTYHYLKLQHLLIENRWEVPNEDKQQLILLLRHFIQEQRLLMYQNALEKTYSTQCLYAFKQAHLKDEPQSGLPRFQYVTCLDDREESLRRYIEQVEPASQTFGIAGHFEMNMLYKGFNEVRFRKLCPGVLKDTFKVVQIEPYHGHDVWSRMYAKTVRTISLHSKISFLSYFITFLVGILSIFPFFIKIFFPYWDLKLRRQIRKSFSSPKTLVDMIFIDEGNNDGLTYEQGADKVFQLLENIGLTEQFCEFIYVVGHGSSSINNPHEYAYNCGACGGGKGRANARVFTTIANTPAVRHILKKKYQLDIPATTRFVGGYHDTCKDHISWFDASIPAEQMERHQENLLKLKAALKLNANERAKKFYNVPPSYSVDKAFKAIATRSNDLTEARPEYNHATNALLVIGRRHFSKHIFLDRRSFLCSYNPVNDDGHVLSRLMAAAVPVCAGISLEYYFSTVDPEVYGCGSKLNHNITNNYAVMSGFASDLRLGLSKQMVEIHDPQRLLVLVETQPSVLLQIMNENKQIEQLIKNKWINLVVFDYMDRCFYEYQKCGFVPIKIVDRDINTYHISQDVQVNAKSLITVALLE